LIKFYPFGSIVRRADPPDGKFFMPRLTRFSRDDRGTIAVIFAVALIPVMGFAGAAIDFARATQTRGKLQAAVDAAAIAALTMKASSDGQRQSIGTAVFQANQPAGVTSTVTVQANNKEATVSASSAIETSLLKVVQIRRIEVASFAKAVRTKDGPPPCVLALSKTASPAIEIGGNADVALKNCVLHANSSASGAISIGGSSTVKANGYCAVGTVSSSIALTPMPESNCDEMKDPYAGLAAPFDTACHPSTTDVKVKPNQTKTLQPGVYCGGLDLQGDVTLKAGLYVIKNGPLSMNSQGSITGQEVTFYLMGANAGFDIAGGAKLELSPTTDLPYKGLLIVQDRNSNVGATSKLNGNATTLLKGAIYAPTQLVRMNGNGTFGQNSPFMPLIAERVILTGNATANVDASSVDLVAPLPRSASGARLAQ
jgi:Flp pilus assembly protein TadG